MSGDTGKTTINYGVNGFPYYFTNGLIYGTLTDLLEDGVREDAAKWARWKTESVEIPCSLFAVCQATTTDCYSCVTVCRLWCMNIHTVATIELLKLIVSNL